VGEHEAAADRLGARGGSGARWSFAQEMSGGFWLEAEGADELPVWLSLRADCHGRRWPVRGEIEVGDLVRRAAVVGIMRPTFRALIPGLGYDLSFSGTDGTPLRLLGELRLRLRNPVLSLTTLDARISATAGRRIGRATLRWDLRHGAATFLRSWRRAPP
jgi:hypothetical protein